MKHLTTAILLTISILVTLILLSGCYYCESCSSDGDTNTAPTVEIGDDGFWIINGIRTEIKAKGEDGSKWLSGNSVPTSEGHVGYYYLNTDTYDIYEKRDSGWTKIGNIRASSQIADSNSTEIGSHVMISNGLKDMAANAVELTVDERTATAYAVYLASESSFGESSDLVKLAKFNVLQPTNIEWIEVFNRSKDFSGSPLSECNIIELNASTVRVFAVNKSNWTYYYKDVNKSTLSVGEMKEVKFKSSEGSDATSFSKSGINSYLSSIGGHSFSELQCTTKIIKVDGCYYATVCGGNNVGNVLFIKSDNGETWTLQSIINHSASYEAMLAYHDSKFWVMCRQGATSETSKTYQNLMYSEDGKSWAQSNLALTVSDTRPYLFTYQGELYLAYSSPLPADYSTVRTWRCNIHVGRIVSENGAETFDELLYKESKFGIVYYALYDWYGSMIMLYSSGELHPTEGLMGGWSQGKDCLNYTILHSQEPHLGFKQLSSISITSSPSITNYSVNDAFDPSGLTVTAFYSDNSSANVKDYSISAPDMSTPGTKVVTVSYTHSGVKKSATFDIVVSEVEKQLTSIEIASPPAKINYMINESFSYEGLVIKAYYNVGSPQTITDYTVSSPDMSKLGEQTITVTYTENEISKTASFTINITENDYIALQYLMSTGQSYIDTGYVTSSKTKVVVKMNQPNNEDIIGGKWVFNSDPKSNNRNFGFSVKPDGAYVLDIGMTRYNIGVVNWQEGVNTITIGNGVFTINDQTLVNGLNVSTVPSESKGTLWFFSAAATSSTVFLSATVYEISVYEGDTLVMHLIPVQRTSDGKVGFYDTVSGKYIFSATSTDFTAGPSL